MEKYLTVKQVAEMVQLTEQTIRRYVMLKQIPFHKINRTVRFKAGEIKIWVEKKVTGEVAGEKREQAAGLFDEAGGKA